MRLRQQHLLTLLREHPDTQSYLRRLLMSPLRYPILAAFVALYLVEVLEARTRVAAIAFFIPRLTQDRIIIERAERGLLSGQRAFGGSAPASALHPELARRPMQGVVVLLSACHGEEVQEIAARRAHI